MYDKYNIKGLKELLVDELKTSDNVVLHNTDDLTIKYRVSIDKDTNEVSVEMK